MKCISEILTSLTKATLIFRKIYFTGILFQEEAFTYTKFIWNFYVLRLGVNLTNYYVRQEILAE
jgi:hypothetical protein